jgi:transglutaminase superfamily protein
MSWWKSSRRKLARFAALSWRDRATMLAVFGSLLGVEAALRLLGLARTRRLFAPRGGRLPPAAAEVERLAALAAAACRAVYPAACLPRALALQRLLAGRGAPAELKIGVRRDGEELAAHAWVEVDGRPVGEPAGVEERFAELREARR